MPSRLCLFSLFSPRSSRFSYVTVQDISTLPKLSWSRKSENISFMQKQKHKITSEHSAIFFRCIAERKLYIFPCQLRLLFPLLIHSENKKKWSDTIAKSWTVWSRKKSRQWFRSQELKFWASEQAKVNCFFQLIFWFLNSLGGFFFVFFFAFRSKVRNNKLSCAVDLYENLNRFLICDFVPLCLVGCLHSFESYWQVFGSTLSSLSWAHERRSDTSGTRHSRLHFPWWPHVIWANFLDASCRDHREDQTKVFRWWYGEFFKCFYYC